MKRKHKSYSRPKRPFDKVRIEEEKGIVEEFGLKNKREIWKADAKIKLIREKAKKIISSKPEEQRALFNQLNKIGLKVDSISSVLSLDKRDYLKRRLQTIVVEKKLATTSKQARQLITHKKVLVNGKTVNIPSYVVPVSLENKITLKDKKKLKKKEETKEQGNSDKFKKNLEEQENSEESKE